MSVLDDIISDKKKHVAARKASQSLRELEAAFPETRPRDFPGALDTAIEARRFGLICEVKKASPSKGVIQPDFEPSRHAKAYDHGGAACISVLTDEPYFQGSDDHLRAARAATQIPILRKDFMIDPYQVAEARALDADCILLIMAALDVHQALDLEAAAMQLGMHVLAEIHDISELDMALRLETSLIGVNNRNLKTLEVNPATTSLVAAEIPADRSIVAESGLSGHAELVALEKQGISRFLIGESLMRQADQVRAVQTFLGQDRG